MKSLISATGANQDQIKRLPQMSFFAGRRKPIVMIFALFAFLILLPLSAYADINDSLKAYWSFDDGTGVDSSGYDHYGKLWGSPQITNNGDCSDALLFDGVDDYVNVGDLSDLDFTGDITLMTWFRTAAPQLGVMVNKFDQVNPENGYCLYMGTDNWSASGKIVFKLANNGSQDVAVTQATFSDNKWHFLAAIYTPNGSARPRIFIDGSEQTCDLIGNPLTQIGAAIGYDFRIAGLPSEPPDYLYKGALDEIRVFNRALSPAEILDIYELCPPLCGDANRDGIANVSDAVYIINYVFAGGSPPSPIASGDANCDGIANVSDAVYIINYVFVGGHSPCDTNGDGIPDC